MTRILLAAVLTLLLGACRADNRSSVEIIARASPDTQCKFTAGGERLLGPGVLDVSFKDRLTYSTVVYVQNNMPDPTSSFPEGTKDAKAWRATSARVRINPTEYVTRYGASPALLGVQTTEILPLDGQTVAPDGSMAQFVDLVSHAAGQAIDAALPAAAGGGARPTRSVVIGLELEGETLDGAKLVTGEWFFTLDVCDGCLNKTGVTPPACPVGQTFASSSCFGTGQDSSVTCTP